MIAPGNRRYDDTLHSQSCCGCLLLAAICVAATALAALAKKLLT